MEPMPTLYTAHPDGTYREWTPPADPLDGSPRPALACCGSTGTHHSDTCRFKPAEDGDGVTAAGHGEPRPARGVVGPGGRRMKRLVGILAGLGLGYLVLTAIAIVVLPGLSALVYGELLPQLAARLGW